MELKYIYSKKDIHEYVNDNEIIGNTKLSVNQLVSN